MAKVEYEVMIFKIGEDQLFYFMQCGLSEENVVNIIVNGFVKEVFNEFLMEFVVEVQKFFVISLEGSVG